MPHYISPESDVVESPGTYLPSCDRPGNNYIKKASEIYDAHVDSLYEEDNFQKSIILKTMGGDEVQRSFIRFELPEMKPEIW